MVMPPLREADLPRRRRQLDEKEAKRMRTLEPAEFMEPEGRWECISAVAMLPGRLKGTLIFRENFSSLFLLHSLLGYRVRATMQMVDPWADGMTSDPDQTLQRCIRFTWEECVKRAHQHNIRPRICLIGLESPALLDDDMYITYDMAENTDNSSKNNNNSMAVKLSPEERFINLMTRVDQSNRGKGRHSLVEYPFVLDLNLVDLMPLDSRQRRAGAGLKRRRPGLDARVCSALHPAATVYPGAVMTGVPLLHDNFCLFRAVQLLLKRELFTDSKKFIDYKKRPNGQLQRDIEEMMRAADIDPHLPDYTLQEHGPKIQV